MRIRRTPAERLFAAANALFLAALSLSMVLPFVHIVAKSFSHEAHVLAKDVLLWPLGFHTHAYRWVLSSRSFLSSFGNSLYVTLAGTVLSMLLTIVSAFPLIRERLPLKRAIMLLYVFTMFFSGGIVPTYLTVRNLGLVDTRAALFLPVAVLPFQLIIMVRFFREVPDSLYESARIDGASNARILFAVFVPLSKAAIATLSMFYAVGYWNDFFNALIYINDRRLMPLQVFLREVIIDETYLSHIQGNDVGLLMSTAPESIRGATIVLAVTPILCVYPFVQKYFIRGLMVGAVKG
jgi:putative aldouronate transport system permease protein